MKEILLSIVLTLAALSFVQAQTQNMSNKDEQELLQMPLEMQKAWNAHNAKAYVAQFMEDANHINAHGLWWKGKKEIEGAVTYIHQTFFKDNVIKASDISIRFVKPDVAIVRYKWSMNSFTPPDHETIVNPSGWVTQIVTKQGGKWLITDFQSTYIDPKAK